MINWPKLCGDTDARQVLHDHYKRIYSLDDMSHDREVDKKTMIVNSWRSLRIDILPHKVTVDKLPKGIAKLKHGKGSSDGVTAEMYKALPNAVLSSLAIFSLCCWQAFVYLWVGPELSLFLSPRLSVLRS